MSTPEEHLIPTLADCLIHWKRYVDNTHDYINPDKLDGIIKILINYYSKIQFTYELEKEGKISFLDVLITRLINKSIEATIFR